jgi:hypothetical protein
MAALSGIFAGGLMALAQKSTNKFNMKLMEEYWNADIKRLEAWIFGLEQKISTLSVDKPVSNSKTFSNNKGYKNRPRFDHRG